MSLSKFALAAVGVAGLLGAAAAHAGTDFQLSEERHVMFMDANGKFVEYKLNDAGHQMIMSHAEALPSGAMVYRSGGKFYILRDQKTIQEIRQSGTM